MTTTNDLDGCWRAIDEFRQEVARTAPDDLDCGELERRLREKVNAVGREAMREVLERADTKAPQITINGKAWGNRRDSKGIYATTFGEIVLSRSIYSQPGGGPVAVGWISTTDTSGSLYLRHVTLLQAFRELVEATGEQRGPEDHDGLSAVLREPSAGALHPNANDRLRSGFGDARPDGAVRSARGGVRHSSVVGLLGEEVDSRFDVLVEGRMGLSVPVVAHRLEDPLRTSSYSFSDSRQCAAKTRAAGESLPSMAFAASWMYSAAW